MGPNSSYYKRIKWPDGRHVLIVDDSQREVLNGHIRFEDREIRKLNLALHVSAMYSPDKEESLCLPIIHTKAKSKRDKLEIRTKMGYLIWNFVKRNANQRSLLMCAHYEQYIHAIHGIVNPRRITFYDNSKHVDTEFGGEGLEQKVDTRSKDFANLLITLIDSLDDGQIAKIQKKIKYDGKGFKLNESQRIYWVRLIV